MKTIYQDWVEGNARARLGIASDILSIAGVSIFAIISGAFSIRATLVTGNIFGATITTLFALAGAALVLALFLKTSDYISKNVNPERGFRTLLLATLWLTFAGLSVTALWVGYEFFVSIKFVE